MFTPYLANKTENFLPIYSAKTKCIYANTLCGVKSLKGDAGHQLCPRFPPGYKVKACNMEHNGPPITPAKGRAAVRETWS